MNCDQLQSRIDAYIYGEMDFHEEEQFEVHASQCQACRHQIEQHRAMLRLISEAEVEPPRALLDQCRAGLRQSLAASSPSPGRWRTRLAGWLPAWGPVARPALACALLALAFFAGREVEQRRGLIPAGLDLARVRTIQGTGNGMVQIVLEEPHQRTIEGGLNDIDIERALLAAARQAPDPGMRVESVELLRNRCNRDDIRKAVLAALEQDESPIVRLRALDALRPHARETEVRQALSRVLARDSSPNVRVQAIDLLMDRYPADIVGTLQEVIRREEDEDVRTRILRVLSQVRASPGVF